MKHRPSNYLEIRLPTSIEVIGLQGEALEPLTQSLYHSQSAPPLTLVHGQCLSLTCSSDIYRVNAALGDVVVGHCVFSFRFMPYRGRWYFWTPFRNLGSLLQGDYGPSAVWSRTISQSFDDLASNWGKMKKILAKSEEEPIDRTNWGHGFKKS